MDGPGNSAVSPSESPTGSDAIRLVFRSGGLRHCHRGRARADDVRKPNSLPALIFVVIFGVGLACAYSAYANNPTAFHLRAMNMLYEGLKKNSATIVIVPSTAVESMQLGGLAGMTALTHTLGRERTPASIPEKP
jgi:hypothetical protein